MEDRDRMNLLGLVLAGVLERNASSPEGRRTLVRAPAAVVVRAGRMAVTLWVGGGRVRVVRGEEKTPRAQVSGSMSSLAQLALGGSILGLVLSRKIRVRGNLLLLLGLRRLLQAG